MTPTDFQALADAATRRQRAQSANRARATQQGRLEARRLADVAATRARAERHLMLAAAEFVKAAAVEAQGQSHDLPDDSGATSGDRRPATNPTETL